MSAKSTSNSKRRIKTSTEIKGASRGGARSGAGRKQAGTAASTVRLQMWERAFVSKVAQVRFRGNLSLAHSAFIEAWASKNGFGELYEAMRHEAQGIE